MRKLALFEHCLAILTIVVYLS